MKKRICLLMMLLLSFAGFSQGINDYKYAIVPTKFKAQKKEGQFGLNNLTKLFMEKNGYIVYFDTDILPADVTLQSCDKIYVDVESDNNMMTTKLKVIIKDCRNAVLFVSEEGKSSDKDNHVAYNQALRAAFKSFDRPEFRSDSPKKEAAQVVGEKPVASVNAVETSGKKEEIRVPSGLALYAQPIQNGFQLVDSTPKVIMKILKTSQPNVFVISGQNGMVVKKGEEWFHEYYEDNGLVTKPLNIKF